MKWYERQKQLYAQKNQPEPQPQEQPQEAYYAEDDPTQSSTEAVNPQEAYEDTQLNEMMQDPDMNNGYGNEQIINEHDYQNERYAQAYQSRKQPSLEATTISKGTLINGNIEAEGDLIIRGHIKGDVLCNANLSVYGVVEGTISCNNALFDNASVIGDIGCSGNMEITQSSTINGNVEAFELLNGGRIKGNATVAQGVHFLSTSAIVGDINANDIQVDRGAVIQGTITIRQEVYFNESNEPNY